MYYNTYVRNELEDTVLSEVSVNIEVSRQVRAPRRRVVVTEEVPSRIANWCLYLVYRYYNKY
jgi:hypothetical protein